MKNEYTYRIAWVTESVCGIDRGEKFFETPESAYTFADDIKKKGELWATFIIKKLELTVIHTQSLI